jgi:hypothetical protein
VPASNAAGPEILTPPIPRFKLIARVRPGSFLPTGHKRTDRDANQTWVIPGSERSSLTLDKGISRVQRT